MWIMMERKRKKKNSHIALSDYDGEEEEE